MKVLLSCRWPVGGIRTFFRYVYGQACFADIDLHLIAPDDGLADYLRLYLPENRVTLHICQASNVAMIRKIRSLCLQHSFDYLHSHGFTAGILSECARQGIAVKHIMTAHDILLESQFSGCKGELKKRLMGRIFANIDCIHTVTKDAENNLLAFFPYLDKNRVCYMPHGIDSYKFSTAQAIDFHQQLGIDKDQPIIGFFGRFMAQKGFRDLVKAMDILSQQQPLTMPVVVTFGWGGFIREDYAFVESLGLSDYFIQAPHVDDMPAALNGVDLVAMPSRWEACGLLGMEALCAGTPLIASDCIGLGEVIEGSPAFACKSEDPQSIVGGITQYLARVDVTKASAKAYQILACERFNIKPCADALRHLYV